MKHIQEIIKIIDTISSKTGLSFEIVVGILAKKGIFTN